MTKERKLIEISDDKLGNISGGFIVCVMGQINNGNYVCDKYSFEVRNDETGLLLGVYNSLSIATQAANDFNQSRTIMNEKNFLKFEEILWNDWKKLYGDQLTSLDFFMKVKI